MIISRRIVVGLLNSISSILTSELTNGTDSRNGNQLRIVNAYAITNNLILTKNHQKTVSATYEKSKECLSLARSISLRMMCHLQIFGQYGQYH